MAQDEMSQSKASQDGMPDVGTPVREKSAGKWLVWFVAILAAACVVAFLW